MMQKVMVVCLLGFVAQGCSYEAVYDNIQMNHQQECNQLPPAQYDDCMARSGKSYEEYEEDRREIMGKD